MQRKEAKWEPTIAKLRDEVKHFEKENQLLHEDNHKLKLKTVSSKVREKSFTLDSPCSLAFYLVFLHRIE